MTTTHWLLATCLQSRECPPCMPGYIQISILRESFELRDEPRIPAVTHCNSDIAADAFILCPLDRRMPERLVEFLSRHVRKSLKRRMYQIRPRLKLGRASRGRPMRAVFFGKILTAFVSHIPGTDILA